MGAAILKPDTGRVLLKYDATHHKLFVLPGYDNVNGVSQTCIFGTKMRVYEYYNIFGSKASYVNQVAKENNILKFLKTNVLSFYNKYLPSCQIYVNEPTTAPASSGN